MSIYLNCLARTLPIKDPISLGFKQYDIKKFLHANPHEKKNFNWAKRAYFELINTLDKSAEPAVFALFEKTREIKKSQKILSFASLDHLLKQIPKINHYAVLSQALKIVKSPEKTTLPNIERLIQHLEQKLSTLKPGAFSQKIPKKVSDIFSKHGYTFLKHKTRKINAVSILKTGYLLTGDKVPLRPSGGGMFSNQSFKVFFDATQLTETPSSIPFHSSGYSNVYGKEWGDLDQVTLIFKLNVLDHVKYHISSYGWLGYGRFKDGDYRHDMDLEKLEPLIKNHCGEIVVYEDVSTKHLTGIWVHPSKKDEMIAYFKQNGVKQINERPIENFF